MTIGDAGGVSTKAVRLWEAKGLLPEAGRTDSGYRTFTGADVDILPFIRRAKALDLSLSEIKEILDLQRHGAVTCSRVTELLDVHIRQIDETQEELSALRSTLDRARQTAREGRRRGQESVICHIIESVPLPSAPGALPQGDPSRAADTAGSRVSTRTAGAGPTSRARRAA